MASGSQSHVRKQTDFRTATRMRAQARRAEEEFQAQKSPEDSKTARTTSPIRLNPIAENELAAVKLREIQVPMRLKLMNPTASQPRRARAMVRQEIKSQTENRNKTNFRAKEQKLGSNSR